MSTIKVNTITPYTATSVTISGSMSANSITGSIAYSNLTNIPAGLVSSSAQLTASYDERYVELTASQTISGSTTFTGSTLGNVVSLSISTNTASIDFNRGNYFTLTLNSGSIPTLLNPSNIRAGQTISLVVTQAATLSGSLTFPTSFKFPTGSYYTASRVTGAVDILTFTTVDTTNIYAVSVKGMGI